MWLPACFLVYFFRIFNFLVPADFLIYGYGVSTLREYQLHKKDFIPTKSLVFENAEFMAPANPDGYLKQLYGNYMQLPPKEKRRTHANKIEFFD
jgi:hypothetical protein